LSLRFERPKGGHLVSGDVDSRNSRAIGNQPRQRR
jgi:hypothetical protein